MANQTYFEIQRGEIVSDCMQETYDFISQNLQYFYQALKPAQEAVSDGGAMTFISHENQWSFAVCVEKSELGKVAKGKGIISEGNSCPYDQLLSDLS